MREGRSLSVSARHSVAAPRVGATPPRERTRFGREVEARVGAALEARGYIVLERNARVGRDEIDLLALDGATLVLVEVRARRNAPWSEAMATVRGAKVRRMRRAALALLAARGAPTELRIDVIAVGTDGVELIENAVDFSER